MLALVGGGALAAAAVGHAAGSIRAADGYSNGYTYDPLAGAGASPNGWPSTGRTSTPRSMGSASAMTTARNSRAPSRLWAAIDWPHERDMDCSSRARTRGRSIPGDETRDWTRAQRDEINKIMKETGCHRCGTRDPGTVSGDAIPDHQPPLYLSDGPYQLFPHCKQCSWDQLQEARIRREAQRAARNE